MSSADLGKFAQGFATWRQILGTVPAKDRPKIFANAAKDIAGFVADGLDKTAAADALADMAVAAGLFDTDATQAIIADAFKNIDTSGKRNGRFTLKKLEAITVTSQPNYLVKGIIPRDGITVVWGPPKCGKSFWTFDVCMHVALGRAYRGHRVQQGAVVYCALEGGHGFRARVEAWRRKRLNGHSERGVPFYLIDEPVDLVADCAELIAAIQEQLGTMMPAALVIDTLNRALIGDENKSEDMARFIRAVDMIRVAFGCAVLVIHHCGVAGSRPRGHSSLTGADDAAIAIERNDDSGIISVKIEHLKDGEAAAPMACKLDRVDLGNDLDGDPITSCVVEPVDVDEALADSGLKLKGVTKLALDQLRELVAEVGERPPGSNHIPQGPDILVCPATLWREHFYAAHLGTPDSKQKAFVRASVRLKDLGLIGIWSDKVWLAGQAGHARTK